VVPRLENDDSFSKPKHVAVTKEDFVKTKNLLTAVLK
jgi:hypothetical protein